MKFLVQNTNSALPVEPVSMNVDDTNVIARPLVPNLPVLPTCQVTEKEESMIYVSTSAESGQSEDCTYRDDYRAWKMNMEHEEDDEMESCNAMNSRKAVNPNAKSMKQKRTGSSSTKKMMMKWNLVITQERQETLMRSRCSDEAETNGEQ
ncbi:hypothetical protein L1987_64509 [Smallanthus sonchifolius]|uniref:Uncharacterized protein n=1 Tax=Smallanthus sonchifolius TaxID=185202 RepID=A0ACB9CG72_9ASTR|nr:hypothetical protein L1987_64509 [Smallanthus sonchifolius]